MTGRADRASPVKMGRPSKYTQDVPNQAAKLARAGWTNEQMAAFFEVETGTFDSWMSRKAELRQVVKIARETPDAEVERSLFERALGYVCDDTHIAVIDGVVVQTPIKKRYPPDPTSMIFWLKNRRPDRWRERKDEAPPVAPEEVARQVQDLIAAATKTVSA